MEDGVFETHVLQKTRKYPPPKHGPALHPYSLPPTAYSLFSTSSCASLPSP